MRTVLQCLLLLALAGCAAAEEVPPEQPSTGPAVIDVEVPPGTAADGYVGARDDVTELTCERDGPVWRAGAVVANPLDEPADYRIYISLLDGRRRTAGVRQVDVPVVQPGEARPWSAEMRLDAPDLTCVLRVERVSAGNPPSN